MNNLFNKILLIFVLIITLTACGFHLRGHEPLPSQLQTLYVASNNPYDTFTTELMQTLKNSGVYPTQNAQAAPVTLQILDQNSALVPVSYGNVGQTTLYTLNYKVKYQLLDRAGITLLEPQTITITRSYSVTSSQISSDLYARQELEQEMRRDAIYQLLNNLRSLKTQNLLIQKLGNTTNPTKQ